MDGLMTGLVVLALLYIWKHSRVRRKGEPRDTRLWPPRFYRRSTPYAARLGRKAARGKGTTPFWRDKADYSGDDWGW